jgi:hypothetical protein
MTLAFDDKSRYYLMMLERRPSNAHANLANYDFTPMGSTTAIISCVD